VPEHARRSFHLSLWEYMEALILPSLVQRLLFTAPGMTISASRVKRRDLEAELARGAVDLAVEIPMTMSDRIRGKALLREPFVVMARKGHPAIKGKLDLDTYLAQHHVQVSSRRHGPSLVDIELSRRGLRREVSLRIQHNCAASMVVNTTDMLLTLPERQARLLNLGSLNRVYPFPLSEPCLEAHLYWHESVENDPANRWLRDQIERSLTPEPLPSRKANGQRPAPKQL
jgi:DNA-binding transcriptional LysR family regulator